MPEDTRILRGVRVLDLTRFLSGPQSTLFLAALGAEVIRIDEPASGDPTANAPPFFGPKGVALSRQTEADLGIAYLKRARAKKAITLNLKAEEGRDLFYRLVMKADVVVENFRVRVTERLRIDYATLARLNPRLIYCSITGYGSTGIDRERKAFDLMVQAATGLMSITGEPDGEACKAGSPLSDGIAGTFAVTGILGALLQRERLGRGQFIDVSMSDCLLSLIFDEPLDCYDKLSLPLRQGNRIMRFSPFNTFPALDGRVVIGAATRQDWVALLDVMGRRDLLDSAECMDPGWRVANNGRVDSLVAAWTGLRPVSEIIDLLDARDIPCSRIRSVSDVMTWSHIHGRGMLSMLKHPSYPHLDGPLAPAFPIKFTAADTGYDEPAALHGQHDNEIYRGILAMSDAEISSLLEKGVI